LMRLWRLAGRRHAEAFDGGYGLHFDGRWNTVGHAVTYCATSPSLCVLEKLVHIEDPALLPELIMVSYDASEAVGIERISIATLPSDWRRREAWTQAKGDAWYRSSATPLLQVPSVVVPLPDCPDENVLVNHSHPAVAAIRLRGMTRFVLDARLF
jgi:RES domain-containing protein